MQVGSTIIISEPPPMGPTDDMSRSLPVLLQHHMFPRQLHINTIAINFDRKLYGIDLSESTEEYYFHTYVMEPQTELPTCCRQAR